jgi:hypothetical protein
MCESCGPSSLLMGAATVAAVEGPAVAASPVPIDERELNQVSPPSRRHNHTIAASESLRVAATGSEPCLSQVGACQIAFSAALTWLSTAAFALSSLACFTAMRIVNFCSLIQSTKCSPTRPQIRRNDVFSCLIDWVELPRKA